MQYTLKKSLGQHYLKDEHICQRIVQLLDVNITKNVFEVGAGAGAITKYLLNIQNIAFKAVEIDNEKVDFLIKTYPQLEHKIIIADILQMEKPYDDAFSIIGNFPYNISSPIMFKVLDWRDTVRQVIGMFQKEVAVRITSKPGTKDYGILSVLVQAFYTVEYMFDIDPSAFNPPPKVISGIIRCVQNNNPYQIENFSRFKAIVKAAFGQRRKTLRNALKSTMSATALSDSLMSKRAEQLSVSDFAYLYHQYK